MKADLDQARRARHILEKVRVRLLHPTVEALNAGAEDLRLAVACLQQLETSLAKGERQGAIGPALQSEIAQARRELRCVQALVAGAGKFHTAWGRLMTAADEGTANYTASGNAAGPTSADPARLVIHG